jgi:hypothetical protein
MRIFSKSELQYERLGPSKDARLIIIFCEGSRREPQYFRYFEGLSTRIRLEIVAADSQSNNSPLGLLNLAHQKILGNSAHFPPSYDLSSQDEVWFVVDTDAWGDQLHALRQGCAAQHNWHVAQSNPCFEVWLYYHLNANPPQFDGIERSTSWKSYLATIVPGGFNSMRHPVLLPNAIAHAEANCPEPNRPPHASATHVYLLGKKIWDATHQQLKAALLKMDPPTNDQVQTEK